MIKEYWAGLATIMKIVTTVRFELYQLNEKKLADDLDDVDYLLGLMMQKNDKTNTFINVLKERGLYDYFDSESKDEYFQISCPHCKKRI